MSANFIFGFLGRKFSSTNVKFSFEPIDMVKAYLYLPTLTCKLILCIYLNVCVYFSSIIQIISRHPMVNGFVRVPPGAWKMLQPPVNTVDFNIPALPIDVLQEIDVLKQFVSRLGVVGWNNKQQFEETWMTLLSVLVPSSETDIPKEELIFRIQVG